MIDTPEITQEAHLYACGHHILRWHADGTYSIKFHYGEIERFDSLADLLTGWSEANLPVRDAIMECFNSSEIEEALDA